jgi:hypothetical protein
MFQFYIEMNYCLAFQKHLENFSFPFLGANKENLLHVTHYIIFHYYSLRWVQEWVEQSSNFLEIEVVECLSF